jgi:hypothetical protein
MTTPELTCNTKSGRISCETIHTNLKPVTGPRVWDLSSQTPAPFPCISPNSHQGTSYFGDNLQNPTSLFSKNSRKQTITNLCIEIYPSCELRKKPKTLNKTHPKTLF